MLAALHKRYLGIFGHAPSPGRGRGATGHAAHDDDALLIWHENLQMTGC
jgi:hypothetical protein